MSSNKTGFRQGRLGIGKEPIFPLDISGSMRIEGDLVLAGTIADIQGNPIEFGASSATFNMDKTFPDPTIEITEFPDWSNNVVVEGAGKFEDVASKNGDIFYNGGNVGIGTTPSAKLHIHSTDGGANDSSPQILITRDPESNYNQWASLELRGSYIGNTLTYGVGIRTTYGWDSNNRYYGDFSIYTYDKDNGNAKTDRLTVTSGGNVGIGTTNPIGKLQIAESTIDGNLDVVFSAAMDANCRLILQRNHGTEHAVIGGSNTIIGDTYYPDWCIENNGPTIGLKFTSKYKTYPAGVATTNDVMFLHYEGNVGIGTTDPYGKVEISDSWSNNGNAEAKAYLNFSNRNGSYPSRWQIGPWKNGAGHKVFGIRGGGSTTDFTALNSLFTVHYDGYVGINQETNISIGTAAKLQVNGTGAFCHNGSSSNCITIGHNGARALINSRSTTHNLEFYVNNDSRMCIKPNGNVGIGTESPDVKLDVNGEAKFSTIGLSSTNYLLFCGAKVYDWYDTTNYWNGGTSSNILLDFAAGPYFFIGFFRVDGVNNHNQHLGNWITLGKGIGAGSWRTKYNHYSTISEKNNGISVSLGWDGDYWKISSSASSSNQSWHIRIVMIDGSLERRRSWGTWYNMSAYST